MVLVPLDRNARSLLTKLSARFGTIAQMVVIYRVLSVLMTAAPRCLCHLPFCHLLAGRNLLYSGVIMLAEKRILSDVSFEACNMGAHCFAGGRAVAGFYGRQNRLVTAQRLVES